MQATPVLQGPSTDILAKPFEAKYQLSPYFKTMAFHSHDFYEIYMFLSGSVSYYIENAGYTLVPGDVLIIPPGSMHRPVNTDPNAVYERCYLWIGRDTLRSLEDTDCPFIKILETCAGTNNYLIHFEGDRLREFRGFFDNIISLVSTKDDAWHLACRSYLTLLFIRICQEIKSGHSITDLIHKNGTIPKVIVYINEHIAEDLSLDGLSEQFFISKYHLIREFKKYTNSTLYAYILSKRIILAKHLIQQGVPPTKACFASGFNNYSNFYKAFLAETGMTPKAFISTSLY